MSFNNHCNELNSQKGLKAYIKKKIINILLKKLVTEPEEPLLFRDKPGLLIDVSHVTVNKNWITGVRQAGNKTWLTGIARVVNNIFHHIYGLSDNVIPIQYKSGKLITSYLYLSRLEGLEEKNEQTIMFQRGDNILLLDDPWDKYDDYYYILDMAAKAGGKSYAIVHDLIPVQYPEVCGAERVIKEYTGWHNMLLQKADALVCVSQTTADGLVAYYKQMKFTRTRPLAVFYFHLGADVPEGEKKVREEIRRFVSSGKFTFLMVGTVEPRKKQITALQALQKLPEEIRRDCRLLIIGKDGWKNGDVFKMLELPELRKNVLWVRDASDGELRWAYSNSSALIAASLQEGFGLPLVEAAHFGLPLICSDIPIFREVTQGNADFFTVQDAANLAECLVRWMQSNQHPDSHKIPVYSWQESAREVLDIVGGKAEPYKVLQ